MADRSLFATLSAVAHPSAHAALVTRRLGRSNRDPSCRLRQIPGGVTGSSAGDGDTGRCDLVADLASPYPECYDFRLLSAVECNLSVQSN